MNEYVPSSWQAHNIDAGTLKSAAIAVFLVVSVSVGSTLGFLRWLDAGIRNHVDPVEATVIEMQDELAQARRYRRQINADLESVRRKIEVIERRQTRRDELILERLDEISEGTSQ